MLWNTTLGLYTPCQQTTLREQMPPKEKLVKGYFQLDVAATTEAGPGEEPQLTVAEVKVHARSSISEIGAK